MSGTVHHDDAGSRLGMWLFLVTETTLFGGLFLVYAYYRQQYPAEFHQGGAQMSVVAGVANTLVLLTSSLTVALGLSAIQAGERRRAMAFTGTTLALGAVFLVIKAFEWSAKFHHGLAPGAPELLALPHGVQLFFALYFTMTGLHGIHVVAGLTAFAVMLVGLARGKVRADRNIQLENVVLFWHLVDVIWIFLLPLFYLAA